MGKKELTPQILIPVRPILIVGANVGGKPNFFEVGGGGLPPITIPPFRSKLHSLSTMG
ncbi:hypothetical protein ACFLTP_02625 [Chloroflexota bacterium]